MSVVDFSSVDFSFPLDTDYSAGKTGVFWDVNDFPVPDGRGIREIVEFVLRENGYTGEISITVYGDKDPFSAEEAAKGGFTFVQRSDEYWRINDMLLDIALWAVNSPYPPDRNPANVMVLAKNKENTDFVNFLEDLNNQDFNVLLVVPDDVKPEDVNVPPVNVAWYWKSIQGDGKPIPQKEFRVLLDQQRDYLRSLYKDDDDVAEGVCDGCLND
uniref:NYN domain-containing protein n=1 Tax=Noccaea caerulescens TaxID=107243 RepID=A0A1J3HCV0_NOCCA